eukprot:m.1653665 g.1653665  ORF g.1653665 m.1653665 type:complete len:77 (+) comp98671_c0_seq1:2-232(+)
MSICKVSHPSTYCDICFTFPDLHRIHTVASLRASSMHRASDCTYVMSHAFPVPHPSFSKPPCLDNPTFCPSTATTS